MNSITERTVDNLTRIETVLACLRGHTTYKQAAALLSVPVEEVQRWEAEFVAAGKTALGEQKPVTPSMMDLAGVHNKLSQINALNAISQSLTAILDLDELLTTAVDHLHWVFGYYATVCVVDGGDIVIKSGYALDGKKINWHDWRLPLTTERNIMAWVASHGRPLNVHDTANDHRYVYQEVIGAVRSELAIPMIFKGNVLGVLNIKSGEPSAFAHDDMSVLETVCFQLAVAIENARLFEAVRRRVAQAELFQRITAKAIENADVKTILTFAVQATHDVMNYSSVAIGLVNDDNDCLNVMAIGTPRNAFVLPIDDSTVIGSAAYSGQIVIANEVKSDARFALNPLRATSQSEMVIPLRSRDTLIGVLNVENDEPNSFDDTDVATLTLLADQLTVAIRSAELREGIERANARFQAVFETTDDGIVVWDETWRILFVNPAASRMIGMSADSLVGLARDDSNIPQQLQKIANARDNEQLELSQTDRIVGRCHSLQWEAEHGKGFLTVIHDITSQIVLEETREEMTSMLIHDLRGPLTSIVSGIEMARLTIVEDNDISQGIYYLNISERSGNVLLNMANSLLEITKMESGVLELDPAVIDVNTLFSDVQNILGGTAQAANVELIFNADKKLPALKVDNGMLQRALQNLVDNALKFTPSGGSVTVTAHRHNKKMIRFDIADTGPGIPEAFRKKIFEKYGQVPGQKGRRRGSGLGLAFCKLVAEVHHGTISVDTRPEGGSIFSLVLGSVG